jgi:hypothetical protein
VGHGHRVAGDHVELHVTQLDCGHAARCACQRDVSTGDYATALNRACSIASSNNLRHSLCLPALRHSPVVAMLMKSSSETTATEAWMR